MRVDFPATARAHQRDEFTAFDVESDSAHSVHVHFAGSISLVDIHQTNDVAIARFHSRAKETGARRH